MTDDDEALADDITKILHEHIAGDGGGMVTAYHLVAEWIDADGEQRWTYITPTGQRMSTTMGLIRWSEGVASYEQQRYMGEISG